MKFQNAIDNAKLTILTLIGGLILSFILNLYLGFGLIKSPNEIAIHIPPHIPADGITLKASEIPPATIYSFAFYVWQSLNYWPASGSEDYKNNLTKFAPLLTPRFLSFLKQDYNNRINQGELQSRISTMQGIYGAAFDAADVEYMGHNTWNVMLSMRLTERMNINDQTVKDTEIKYVLRVVRYPINPKTNPWGLAIDGFVISPERINTKV